MTSTDEITAAYAAAWTERDETTRRELLARSCEPDVRFLQEGWGDEIVGIAALSNGIAGFQAGWPDGVDVHVELTTPAVTHHGYGRGGFVWVIGEDRFWGTDFVELGEDGKLRTIVVFSDAGRPPS